MGKRVKIAVVGVGLMGRQHLKAIKISKKATLHSIVDINKKSFLLSKNFKVPFYQDTNELLKSNKPDAVIIATTGNSTDFGDLTQARAFQPSGCSDSHGGLS